LERKYNKLLKNLLTGACYLLTFSSLAELSLLMLLHIHVKPNSKTDSISRSGDGNIRVKIRAQPVEGKANKYLMEYLAGVFRLSKSQVEIAKGENSPYKTIKLDADEGYVNHILKSVCSQP
jgi:uncharacterized protein